MRTPGSDRDLVLGFLFAEGIIRDADDVTALAPCGRTGDEGRENTLEVTLAPGVVVPGDDGPFARRGTITTSACGVCGRRSIDDLLTRFTPLEDGDATISHGAIARLAAGLRERQPFFARTGGCHAATLATFSGEHVVTFEDVGRHNAVDKVVGSRVRAKALSLGGHVLLVSGRASFEIVQKAIAARIPVIASVSAPSSLAVDLARSANVTLLGFVRGESLTVYSAPRRLTGA
ncbi:formate dehydrogenase accessory sulfurtransferase FdhD [soil metagenome]